MATRYKLATQDRAESVTGLKTFDTTKLAVKGSSTGSTAIASANAGATDYTQTLQAKTGTIANSDDTFYIGTTQVALNRASAALTLAGITLTTPDIGVATATSVNKITITAPATSATLTIVDGQTLTVAATASVSGTNTGDNAANTSIAATKLDDFTAPDDNTDLNATTTAHGLLLKATAPAAGLYNYVGITNGETAYTNKALFDATVPSTQAYGDAAATGSAAVAARRDHKHAMPAEVTRATLGLATGDSPQFTAIELGAATDTSITRVSAGLVAIEGANIMTVSSADTVTGVKTLGTTGAIKLGSAVTDKCEIRLNDSALNDETWSGTVLDAVAGATIAVGDVCYLKTADGQWYPNDGILDGTDAGFKLKLGICVLAANDNGATKMLLDGLIASAAFPTFTIGAPVHLDDTEGDLVVAQPSTTNFAIRVVGEAVSATVLHFHPSNDYIVHV